MNTIPYVSILHFYRQLTEGGRRLFMFLLVLLLLACTWWIYGVYSGTDAGLSYQTTEVNSSHPVDWQQVSEDHPLFVLRAYAVQRFGLVLPGNLGATDFSILIFLFFLIAGWSAILAATSRIKAYWNLLPVFLFSVWLRLSNSGEILMGSDPGYIFTLLICLVFIGLLYYFRKDSGRTPILIQFSAYVILLCLLCVSIFIFRGMPALSHLVAGIFPFHFILACCGLIYFSKEPVHLILAILNNRPEKFGRVPVGLIGITLVFYIFLLLYLAYKFTGFTAAPAGWILPVWIGVITLLSAPFTVQHIFHALRNVYAGNIAFTLVIISSAIWTAAFMAYGSASGEMLIRHQADRILTSVFPLMAILQVIYLAINFFPYLRKRENVYFILMMPTRIRFLIIWFILAVVILYWEAGKGWKSYQILSATAENQMGDFWQSEGNTELALAHYSAAINYTPGDPKGNYNAGLLLLKPNQDPRPALNLLSISGKIHPEFTAGDIRAAAYWAFTGRYEQAKALLNARYGQHPDPYTGNYLAWLHYKQNQPDSAILLLQEVLLQDPDFADAYSNLGLIYGQYDKPELALKFLQYAVEAAGNNPGPVSNFLYYQLNHGDTSTLHWNQKWLHAHTPESFLINALLWCSKQGAGDTGDATEKILESRGGSPDQLMYRMVRCMQTDSVAQALSRYKYLSQTYRGYENFAAHNMACLYYAAGVPEMAQVFFETSASSGKGLDLILSGILMAEQGEQDSAFSRFKKARTGSETEARYANKECALLLWANGQEVYARMDWDFKDARYTDWMRGARYAKTAGNRADATDMLRNAIQMDSGRWEPYDFLASWMLAREDSIALEIYREGLAVLPENTELQIGYIRALRLFGQTEEAFEKRKQLIIRDSLSRAAELLFAEEALAAGNHTEAATILNTWLEDHPLDKTALYMLGNTWLQAGDPGEASAYFFNALILNDRSPELWLYYAQFSSEAGLNAPAGYGALQAIHLTKNAERKKEIQENFKAEIEAWEKSKGQ